VFTGFQPLITPDTISVILLEGRPRPRLAAASASPVIALGGRPRPRFASLLPPPLLLVAAA
jgi:hypothetical protein